MNCEICGKPLNSGAFVWNGKRLYPSIHAECETDANGCAGRRAKLKPFELDPADTTNIDTIDYE